MEKVYTDVNGGTYVVPDGANVTIKADWLEVTNQSTIDAIVNPTPTPEQIYADKWALVDAYEATLEVTLLNTHRYAVNRIARQNIREEIDNFSINLTTITWIEEWGSFQTDQAELQQVLIEATAALRAYRTLVFGV